MPYLLPFVLMMLALPAVAATVTVNGQACGSLTSITIKPAGDVIVLSDTTCGTVAPPVAPPVEPPAGCPAGVTCLDKTLPIPQQSVTLVAGKVLAVRFRTGVGGGTFSTINTPSSSPNRRVALSATAGDMNPANSRCASQGYEVTSSTWVAAEGTRACVVPPNTVVYANIQPTNCESRCAILIKAQ